MWLDKESFYYLFIWILNEMDGELISKKNYNDLLKISEVRQV